MDVVRVHAPSEADALRLMAAIERDFSTSLNGDGGRPVVGITLDTETATKLVELFDALGAWAANAGMTSCHIGFGERAYTLLPASAGEANDPAAFLLERAIQLQTALKSRVVIEQAKGVLAERNSSSPDEAFDGMRREARSRRIKLHDLAAEIVATAGVSQQVSLPDT
jgi:ANTAR domain